MAKKNEQIKQELSDAESAMVRGEVLVNQLETSRVNDELKRELQRPTLLVLKEINQRLKHPDSLTDEDIRVIKEKFIELIQLRDKNPDLVNEIAIPIIRGFHYLEFYQDYIERGTAPQDEKILAVSQAIQNFRDHKIRNGEVLFELEGIKKPDIKPHPEGFALKVGDKIFLNGNHLVFEGKCDEWFPHPKGVVIRINKTFLLNGREPIYQGAYNEAWETDKGLMIRKKNEILLDGAPYQTIQQGDKIIQNPHGVMVQKDAFWGTPIFNLLYKNEVHAFHTRGERFAEYRQPPNYDVKITSRSRFPHPNGLILEAEDYIDITHPGGNKETRKLPVLLLTQPGTKRIGRPLTANYTHLYCGDYDDISPHPDGVIVRAGQALYLNDNKHKIYDGEGDEYLPHRDGILVRKGKQWRLYTGEKK